MVKDFKPPAFEQLASVDTADCEYATELAEITGLVSLAHPSYWSHANGFEVICFKFSAWRGIDQILVQTPLTILRPVQKVGKEFYDFEKGSIHRIQVILSTGQTRAVLARWIGPAMDTQLEEIGQRLKEENVVVQTERFGPLTRDWKLNCFNGQADWNGQVVSITIEADADFDLTNQLKTAEALFSDAKTWGQKVRQFAVQEKLELANQWQEGYVSADEFLKRMALEAIWIYPEGHFDFYHTDGNLFRGHWILVSGSLKEGLTDADIAG